jgi:hypothetical protein
MLLAVFVAFKKESAVLYKIISLIIRAMNGFTKLPTSRYVNNNPDCKLFKSTLKLRFNTTKPIWQDEQLYNNVSHCSIRISIRV